MSASDDQLTLDDWRSRALAAETLVGKLRGLIQKLEDDKAALLNELAESSGYVSDRSSNNKRTNFRRRSATRSGSTGKPESSSSPDESVRFTDKRSKMTSKRIEISPAALLDAERPNFVASLREELPEYAEIFEKPIVASESPVPKFFSEKLSKNEKFKFEIELEHAPIPNLIEYLLVPPNSKLAQIFDVDTFIKEFIVVFRGFMTRSALLTALSDHYSKSQTKERKDAVVHFMKLWIEFKNAADFQDAKIRKIWDPMVIQIQHDKEMQVSANFLCGYIENLTGDEERSKDLPAVIEPPQGKITLLCISSLELARQITLMLEAFIRVIPRQEFLKQKCHKAKLRSKSPKLGELVHFVKLLGGWIAAEVLSQPDRKVRIQILEKFIEVTKHSRQLNNFIAVFVFISNLQGVLTRLKKDWKEVSKEHMQDLEALTAFTDNSGKFKNYRNQLDTLAANDSALLVTQIAIGDIEKLDEISPDHVDPNQWINWFKFHTLAKIITPLIQDRPLYALKENDRIQKFILESESWTNSNALYFLSSLRESVDDWAYPVQKVTTKSLWEPHAGQLTNDDWKYLLRVTDATTKKYASGVEIITEGLPNFFLFRICKGEAAIKGKNNELIKLFKAGEIFGEMSLCLQGHAVTKTVYAHSIEVEVQLIEFSELGRRLVELPQFAFKFYHWLAHLLAKRLVKERIQDSVDDVKCLLSSTLPSEEVSSKKKKDWHHILSIPDNEEIEVFQCQMSSSLGKTATTLAITTEQVVCMRTTFGFTKIDRLPIASVNISKKKKATLLINTWQLSGFSHDSNEVFTLISSLQELAKSKGKGQTNPENGQLAERWEKTQALIDMSPDDWEILLKGATKENFTKGAPILEKEDSSRVGQMFQLVSGSVDVQLKGGQSIATMSAPDLFGEISFLTGDLPTASIVAKEDLQVVILDPFYLNILFQHYPDIGGRFHFFLSQSIATRMIRRRQLTSDH